MASVKPWRTITCIGIVSAKVQSRLLPYPTHDSASAGVWAGCRLVVEPQDVCTGTTFLVCRFVLLWLFVHFLRPRPERQDLRLPVFKHSSRYFPSRLSRLELVSSSSVYFILFTLLIRVVSRQQVSILPPSSTYSPSVSVCPLLLWSDSLLLGPWYVRYYASTLFEWESLSTRSIHGLRLTAQRWGTWCLSNPSVLSLLVKTVCPSFTETHPSTVLCHI